MNTNNDTLPASDMCIVESNCVELINHVYSNRQQCYNSKHMHCDSLSALRKKTVVHLTKENSLKKDVIKKKKKKQPATLVFKWFRNK